MASGSSEMVVLTENELDLNVDTLNMSSQSTKMHIKPNDTSSLFLNDGVDTYVSVDTSKEAGAQL